MGVDVKTSDPSDAIFSYKYSGIVNVTPGVGAVLTGHASAKTTPFGDCRE